MIAPFTSFMPTSSAARRVHRVRGQCVYAVAPIVLFEVNAYTCQGFGFGTSDAKDFLANLPTARYRFFEVKDDGALPAITTLTPWCNVLAIPEAKLSRFSGLRRDIQ